MSSTTKYCLITGCSQGGVGTALAESFSHNGYHVFATARTTSKIPASLHDSPNVMILALDVTDHSSIVAVEKVVGKQTNGSLDVLVNNAGAGMTLPMLDSTIPEARKLFDLNFFAALDMIQAFAPMLIKAGGCIVNNASVGGMRPLVFTGIYGASKAAMIQAGEALRLEMAPLGLVTGGVATKFVSNVQEVVLPEGSYYTSIKDIIGHESEEIPFAISPEQFAQGVLREVERGTAGKVWMAGGALMARIALWILPEWAIDRMYLSMKQPFSTQLMEERKKRV